MQDVLVTPDVRLADPLVPARINVAAVRRSEWVIGSYAANAAGGA
jgi:hypothetical protein